MKNGKKVWVVVFLMITFMVILTCVFLFNREKEDENKVIKDKENTYNWIKNDKETNLVKFYYSFLSDEFVFARESETDNYGLNEDYDYLNSYGCILDNCRVYGVNKEKGYVIIKDNGYILYDYNNDLYSSISLPNNDYKDVFLLSYDGKDYGLAVSNETGKYAFFDLKKARFTTEFKYDDISSSDLAGLSLGVFSASLNDNGITKYYLVDYETGEVKKESLLPLKSSGNKDNVYFYELGSNGKVIVYDNDFNLLFNGEEQEAFGVSDSGNLAVKKDNGFSIYNKKGTLIKESKPYERVLLVYDDYVVVEDNDNYLKVIDYDGNVTAKFTFLDEENVFDDSLSGIRYLDGNKVISLPVHNLKSGEISFYYYDVTNNSSGVL